ncbi:1529_t:CDS:1, partial [Scutellospora calospora]
EHEILDQYSNYREHYQVKFPEQYARSIQLTRQSSNAQFLRFSCNYQQTIDKIVNNMPQDITLAIRDQLENLMNFHLPVPCQSLFETPPD